MKTLLNWLAAAYVLLFVAIWGILLWQLFTFTASGAHPVLPINDAMLTTAGFLATSVGAGTAAVLGIEVQRVKMKDRSFSLAVAVSKSAGADKLLTLGIIAYAVVGLAVLISWLLFPEESPDLIKTFALASLGWFAGVFAATFKVAPY